MKYLPFRDGYLDELDAALSIRIQEVKREHWDKAYNACAASLKSNGCIVVQSNWPENLSLMIADARKLTFEEQNKSKKDRLWILMNEGNDQEPKTETTTNLHGDLWNSAKASVYIAKISTNPFIMKYWWFNSIKYHASSEYSIETPHDGQNDDGRCRLFTDYTQMALELHRRGEDPELLFGKIQEFDCIVNIWNRQGSRVELDGQNLLDHIGGLL